jgi:hypothetical protein
VEKWETERTVIDADEHERAIKARSKARALITAVCAHSDFGLLCRQDAADQLRAAVTEARRVAGEFNASARLNEIQINVIVGVIAADDAEAVKAINNEIRGLLDAMQSGLRQFDVAAIRDAADRARKLGTMLAPEAAGRIQKAIEVARNAARNIVKAGEAAAIEVDSRAIKAITEARTAFLDLDEAGEIQAPAIAGRALDLNPDDGSETPPATYNAAPRPQFALEL